MIGERHRGAQERPADVDARVGEREQGHDRRSSSTGAGRTGAARWARSPTARRAVPSAPAPASAARETSASVGVARSRSSRDGGYALVTSPTASPAITGSMPDLNSATQSADAQHDRALAAARSARSAARAATANSPTATASGTSETCSVYTVAITSSAPRSSNTASVSRNTRSRVADRGVSSASAPSANAVSVDIAAPQPWRARAAGVEREVDRDRHHHPPDRGDHGDRQPLALAQLAHVHLALGLEPDDEEEERHQPLVDPVAQVGRDPAAAELDRELGASRPTRYECDQGELAHTSAPRPSPRAARPRCRSRCSGSREPARRGFAPTRSCRCRSSPGCQPR